MTHTPRAYQARAVDEAVSALQQHHRVILTLPTGAGKSIVGHWIGQRAASNPLWIAPRREIVDQLQGRAVTIQSLLGGDRPEADLLIYDECHHAGVSAPAWFAVAEHYPNILGLTATPERATGEPMGDLFNHLIVGATYSELIRDGYLLEPRVVRPGEELEGLAQAPAKAWRALAGERQGFAFFGRVELAEKFAKSMNSALFRVAEVVTGETPKQERAEIMDRFKLGDVKILASVGTMTEGVDVPRAEVAMVARGCQHAGAWLQMVGRVLRPSPGKDRPLVIDLAGVSHRLGLPHEDRIYSLEGQAIRRRDAEAIQQCAECGAVYAPAPCCPECGAVPVPKPASIRVWNVALEEIGAEHLAELTPDQRGKLTWKQKMMDDDAARLAWLRKKAKHPGHAAAMHASMFGRPMPRAWWGALKRGR